MAPPLLRKAPDNSFTYSTPSCPARPYPSLIVECGFTDPYDTVLQDTRQWLEHTDGEVRLVILIKLNEARTATIPPPLSLDTLAEDDNYVPPGYDPAELHPGYEHLRDSTVTDEWVGPLTGFAEKWRLDKVTGRMCRDGDRITILPCPEGGHLAIKISKADMKGYYATPEDHKSTFDLDLGKYSDILVEAVKNMAFTRRVRYLKAMEAKEGEGPQE